MKEELLDKIEAYLNGDMSLQDEQAFDQAIKQDPELAAAVDNYGVANDALELLIEDNLRKELNQLKAAEASSSNVVSINKKKSVAKRRSLRTYLAAAASVALLLGFFGMNWAGNNYSNTALRTAFDTDFSMPSTRSNGNTLHPFAEGFTAYKENDYDKAIGFFENVVVDDPRYAEAQFYLGHALMKRERFQEAATKFKNVATLNDVRFTERAEWNQLLAQLAADNVDTNFQTLLAKIANDKNHTFNAKAIQLQHKLTSFWRKLVF